MAWVLLMPKVRIYFNIFSSLEPTDVALVSNKQFVSGSIELLYLIGIQVEKVILFPKICHKLVVYQEWCN